MNLNGAFGDREAGNGAVIIAIRDARSVSRTHRSACEMLFGRRVTIELV